MFFVLLIFSVLLTWYLWMYLSKTKALPPGPLPFPLFGNLPHFGLAVASGHTVVEQMLAWKERYGSAVTVWLGPIPAVFVMDYDLAVDMFVRQGDAFLERVKPPLAATIRKGMGIVMADGERWVEQRRFALHTLRNFGLGRNLMQQKVLAEFDQWRQTIDEGKGADPKKLFNLLIGSIVSKLILGITFTEDNLDEFWQLKQKMEAFMNGVRLSDFFIGRMPFLGKHFDNAVKIQMELFDYMRQHYRKRREEIDSGKHSLEHGPQDFVDAYIMEMNARSSDNMGYFSEEQLFATLLDMWTAGQESMVMTLLWSLILLVNNSEVQTKMREELLKVVGQERNVEERDRLDLPYTVATINEIQRVGSILNLNLFRRSTKETTCGSLLLPRGTVAGVIMSFNPERFLDGEEGRRQQQMMIPFGLGKRACMGEGLARMELFLILSNLIKSFKVTAGSPEGWIPEEVVQKLHLFRRPKPFTCYFKNVQ
ncbi:hypothetical protein QR680_014410 [Steinernema hermaphroditum]|uniref:Cytochrome P450 n=1 Tax=Steinernema hermaphroditum TaxID=289476 RepID=A0AA39M459_9BILA|nr:hypothetical protein QR680_014410 [Steinernema hermaphroditum]